MFMHGIKFKIGDIFFVIIHYRNLKPNFKRLSKEASRKNMQFL